MDAFACYGGLVAVVVALFAVAVVQHGLRSKDSWIARGTKVQLGVGEYRSALSTSDPRLLRRRWLVLGVAATNIVWAAITFLVLVPAGVLIGDEAGPIPFDEGTVVWFWWCMLAAGLDGIPLSILLVAAAFSVVRRSEKATFTNALAAAWSFVHHAAVAGLGIAVALTPEWEEAGMATAVCGGIGLAQAIACGSAAWLARPEPALPG